MRSISPPPAGEVRVLVRYEGEFLAASDEGLLPGAMNTAWRPPEEDLYPAMARGEWVWSPEVPEGIWWREATEQEAEWIRERAPGPDLPCSAADLLNTQVTSSAGLYSTVVNLNSDMFAVGTNSGAFVEYIHQQHTAATAIPLDHFRRGRSILEDLKTLIEHGEICIDPSITVDTSGCIQFAVRVVIAGEVVAERRHDHRPPVASFRRR